MKKYREQDAFYHYLYCIKNRVQDCLYTVWEHRGIQHGQGGGFDENKIVEYGLYRYELKRLGGAMITQPGDISCAYIVKGHSDFTTMLKRYFINKLKEKGINAYLDNNDLLIDDKKCFGSSKTDLGGGWYFYGVQISVTVDVDMIKDICTKPMEKEPVGFLDYGITTEEIESWLKDFWFYYKK